MYFKKLFLFFLIALTPYMIVEAGDDLSKCEKKTTILMMRYADAMVRQAENCLDLTQQRHDYEKILLVETSRRLASMFEQIDKASTIEKELTEYWKLGKAYVEVVKNDGDTEESLCQWESKKDDLIRLFESMIPCSQKKKAPNFKSMFNELFSLQKEFIGETHKNTKDSLIQATHVSYEILICASELGEKIGWLKVAACGCPCQARKKNN